MPRIPARFAPIVFGLLLSGFMSLIVSGIATARVARGIEGFPQLWMGSWISSWLVAFPVVLFAAPVVRRVVALICAPPAGQR